MKSQWNEKLAQGFAHDPLKLRVYTSRLLGLESSLVLHGGGNTSVKATVKDFYGDTQEVLYIKGSGWDLATIEEAGFAAVRLAVLKRMAMMDKLSDTNMVREQRAAMLNPNAPNPSVEAILHAIIPFKFVDHTHTDAIVAITNTPDGLKRIQSIYGERVLIVPYVMPGFVLARKVYEMTRNLDWTKYQGIVLLNHGLFTFADDAKKSYEDHLKLVTQAEQYIAKQKISLAKAKSVNTNLLGLAQLRHAISRAQHAAVIARLDDTAASVGFANLSNVKSLATVGTLTPDHVIRTKPTPVIVEKNIDASVEHYSTKYQQYFNAHTNGKLKCLDVAPRWAVWPGQGTVSFGASLKEALISADIIEHTIKAIQWSQAMGGWKPISTRDIFEMEYWELEQAKLGKSKALPLQGKIALVTGAASGIGKACAERLMAQGAHVAALDINPAIKEQFKTTQALGMMCDVTDEQSLADAVDRTVKQFGGLDILVSNAGIFTPSENIDAMHAKTWDKSIAINLTSHQRLMTHSAKYLNLGIDPTIIIIASKNVPAPGPGAAAYSVAKAGLTQLARVAALEMGAQGIRVNVVHPNQVFDTAIWTPEVLAKRAKNYGLSIEQYKTNNILKTEITSYDVGELVATLAGPIFNKTTGAQISIDGGNDRVI